MISTQEYQERYASIITAWEPFRSPDGSDSYNRQVVLSDGTRRLVKASDQMCVTIYGENGGAGIDPDFTCETRLMDNALVPRESTARVSTDPDESGRGGFLIGAADVCRHRVDKAMSKEKKKQVRQAVAFDALSENTKTAYQKAIKRLDSRGVVVEDLTDESLAVCISQLHKESLSPATLSLTIAAVKWYFKHIVASERDWTTTDKRLIKIKRDTQGEGNGQVDGLDWSDVDVVCRLSALDGTARGLRDAVLIRLMSDCLLRISEAVAVNVEDLKDNALTVARSKTDQTGEGATLYIGDETKALIQRYCEIACVTEGALFRRVRRGDHVTKNRLSVNGARDAIKAAATLAGIEGFISGHSLRVGSAVSLAKAGASVVEMQVAGRWKSPQMPAHYARAQEAERGAVARLRYGKGTG